MQKENGIQRTSYNILGAPKQDEQSMLDTIEFNRLLKPDPFLYITTRLIMAHNHIGMV